MAENVQSDIIINVDTSVGIAEIKQLQRQISSLNAQLMSSGAAQAKSAQNIQRNLLNNINATGDFAARVKTIASTTETFTTRLEKNKMGMGEYFRYAGASSKTFGKLFRNEFDTIEKVARERVKTLQTQYIKLGRDANGALKAISVRPLALDMENLATKTAMAAQKQQLMNQLLKQGSTNLLNFGKNTQWAGRQLMVGFSIPLAMLGTAAAKTFMQMEEQAIRFKRVYGEAFTSNEETDKMLDQVKRLASEFTKYGVAVEETMKMAANAAAMGKQGADLLAQVNQAARLAVLGGVEQEQALETTISLTNAFAVSAENLAGKVNFLNAVENQTVTSIEDLTIAIPKAGPVVQQLGGDVEDLAFFLTAMKEGGINASEGANALKSGLAALINPTKKASEMLGAMGVNITAIVESNKGDVKGTVVEFAKALDTLDPLNRARAIEQLFGKFQFSRLSTLFQNVIAEGSQASKVLSLTNSTTQELAILSERELKRVQDSPMYKFKKVVEDLKVSLVPLGEAFLKAITPLGEFVKGFLDRFNSMGDGAKQFAVIATTVVAGIGPVLLMTFGLIANGAANLIKLFLGMGKMFQRTGKGSQTLGSQTEYMTQQQLEAAAVAASLDQTHGKLIQTFSSETKAVDALARAYARAVVAQSKLSGVPIGAAAAKSKGPKAKKFASGVVSVPGPKGAGDVVPAMLSPGESVIPAEMTKKYGPLISGMVDGTIPGFASGVFNFGGKQFSVASQSGVDSLEKTVKILLANNVPQEDVVKRLEYLQEKSISRNEPFLNAKNLARHFKFKPSGEKETNRGSGKSAAPEKVRLMGQPAQIEFEEERKFLKRQLEKLGITLSDGQIKNALQMQASHIMPEKNADGTKNWANLKNLIPDLGYVNGYLNDLTTPGNKFSESLVRMAAQDPKSLIAKGIDPDILGKILSGKHPTSKAEIATLRAISQEHMKFLGPSGKNFYRPLMVDQGLAFRQDKGYYKTPVATYDDRVTTGQFGSKKARQAAAAQQEAKVTTLPKTQQKPKTTKKQATNLSDILKSIPASRGLRRYATGVVSVPGPKGAGDVVPAMLSPGEAVIPTKMSEKYAPLISAMVNGTIPGYEFGNDPFDTPNPFGGDPSIPAASDPFAPAPGSSFGAPAADPFGSSSSFDDYEKENRKLGGKFADAFKEKVIPSATQFGKNVASEMATGAKTVGKNVWERSKKGILESAARGFSNTKLGQKMSGGAGVTSQSGKTYVDGKEATGGTVVTGTGAGSKSGAGSGAASANPATAKQTAREKFGANAQKAGMIGMGVSMATSAATMLPGEAGKVAGDIAPLLLGLSAMTMMIQGPVSAGLVALAAAVAVPLYAMFKSNEAFGQAQDAALALGEAMGVGSGAMVKFAEFAGNVTSKEIMDRRRTEGFDGFQIKNGKNTFGKSFLGSDAGKSLLDNTQKTIASGGDKAGISQITAQMATAVSSGAMSAAQARSVVAQLAEEMGDYNFGIQVNSELMSMIGPDGENLLTDPLGVRVKMLDAQQGEIDASVARMNKVAAKGFQGTGAAIGGAIAGGLAGAGIGAAIGTVFAPGPGTAIGAAIGGLVGLVSGGITGAIAGNTEQVKAMGTAAAANVAIQKAALEQQQEISDSLEMEYEKRIAVAEAAGDLVKKEELLGDLATARLAMMKENGELNKQILDSYKNAQSDELRSALQSGAEKAVKKTYKDTAMEDVANLAQLGINDSNLTGEQKYLLTLDLSTQAISPTQMIDILSMSEKSRDIVIGVAASYGGATANELSTLVGMFVDPVTKEPIESVQTDFLLNIQKTKTPEEFKDTMEFYKKVSQSGAVLNTAVVTDYLLKNPDVAERLDGIFDKLRDTKGKISLKVLADVVGAKEMAAINNDLAYFEALSDDEKKVYTQVLATTLQTTTVADDKFKNWLNSAGSKFKNASDATQLTEYANWNSRAVTDQVKADGKVDEFLNPTPTPTGGTKEKNPLDDILSRLKMVRDASIKATGGIKELLRVVGKNGEKNISSFTGVEQNLIKRDNVSSSFMDFYDSLDEKAKSTYVKISGSGAKAVARLTADGRKVQAALREISIGDYQSSLVQQRQDLVNSSKAFNMLKSAGMSAADALEVSRDAALANAIATAASKKEVIDLVNAYKALANAQTAADRFQKTFDEANAAWDAERNKIELKFEIDTEAFQKAVTDAQNEIAKKTNEAGGLDDLQAGLTEIGWAEDEINKKYDLRTEALDRVAKANDKILASQKGQLTIADALSRGDISAAAVAIQDQRAQESQNAIQSQRDLMDNARKAELGGITTTVNGVKMTRRDIEAKILTIEKEIFAIEEKRLEPANESIRLKEVDKVAALKSLDLQEREWRILENDIALAASAAWDYVSALTAAKDLAAQAVLDAKNGSTGSDKELFRSETVTNPPPVAKPKVTTGGSGKVDTTKKDPPPAGPKLAEGQTSFVDANGKTVIATKTLKPGTGVYNGSQFVQPVWSSPVFTYKSKGGMIPNYLADGGSPFAKGTDTVPAMLTPGEFVMSKYAVDSFGVENMKAINSGASVGSTVYNSYDLNVNVRSDANPNEIARAVMTQIKQVDSQRIRGVRL